MKQFCEGVGEHTVGKYEILNAIVSLFKMALFILTVK